MDRVAFTLLLPLVIGGLRVPAGSTLVFRRHEDGGSTVTACVEVEGSPGQWAEMVMTGVLQPIGEPGDALGKLLGIVGPSGAPPAVTAPADGILPLPARQLPAGRG